MAIRKKGGPLIARRVKRASGFFERAVGLMFSHQMEGFDALLLRPCQSVHTFFMHYPIDVVFLNKTWEVVGIVRAMVPWRVTGLYLRADSALEIMGDSLPVDIRIGDQLEEVICTNSSL